MVVDSILTALSPSSISVLSRAKHRAKENGIAPSDMDEATRQKAEAKYLNYYELYQEANPDAQGVAPFH